MELSLVNSRDTDTSKAKTSVETDIEELASFSDLLFFIGDAIIIFTKSDRLSLLAANIKLVGGILALAAAIWDSSENSKNKNDNPCIPSIKNQVIVGAVISQIGAMILTDALQKNISISGNGTVPIISPF